MPSSFTIRNDQVLFELFSPGNDRSVLVDNKTVAVEDEFVLSTDGIDVSNNHRIVGCPRRKHVLPEFSFADAVGRCVDINDDLSACQCLRPQRPFGIPHVFADVHPDPCIADPVYGAPRAGLKIPVFIKNAVIRKVHLVIDADDLLPAEHCSGIIDIVLSVDESHDCRNIVNVLLYSFQSPKVIFDKTRFEQKILRGISGNCEFGKDHDICAGFLCLPDGVKNL